jgi:putative colanic acid biosynthesis UDP-glucose lipid carrier transferase
LFIALPAKHLDMVDKLYVDLLDTPIDVVWAPDFANILLLNHSVSEIDGLPAIHLSESPLTANPSAAFVKSLIDRFAALCAILVLSPVLIGAAIAVKLSSPGPVLFKQERHGLNGRIFHMWKYRSMRLHDDTEVKQATKGDSRITPVGAFIRKTSIDELPQLFNVLFGDMSLVGPRPHAVQHNDYYTGKIQAYMARHKVKPGMTGWAQVNGSRGETETIEKMKKRLEYDLEYINTWSIWLDVQILLKTPLALLKDEAY